MAAFGRIPGVFMRTTRNRHRSCQRKILETLFYVEDLRAYGTLFFRHENSFQDLLARTCLTCVTLAAEGDTRVAERMLA
jgi:hypothetical protein